MADSTYKIARDALKAVYDAAALSLEFPQAKIVSRGLPIWITGEQITLNPTEPDKPLVHVFAHGYDEMIAARSGCATVELVVGTAIYMRHSQESDGEQGDLFADRIFVYREQLATLAKTATFLGFTWVRNEDPRDETGVPYSVELNREANAIQSVIHSTYQGARR